MVPYFFEQLLNGKIHNRRASHEEKSWFICNWYETVLFNRLVTFWHPSPNITIDWRFAWLLRRKWPLSFECYRDTRRVPERHRRARPWNFEWIKDLFWILLFSSTLGKSQLCKKHRERICEFKTLEKVRWPLSVNVITVYYIFRFILKFYL